MVIGLLFLLIGFGLFVLSMRYKMKEDLVAQIDDLRAAIGQLGTDLGEMVIRVEAKIMALGEPDPDLTSDIQNLKNFSAQLDAFAADPTGNISSPDVPAPAPPVTPAAPTPPSEGGAATPTPDVTPIPESNPEPPVVTDT